MKVTRSRYLAPAALIAGVLLMVSSVVAQQPKFKVGDRVEFSENSACLGQQFAIPSKGTILEVNTDYKMNYVIQVDPLPGKAPRIVTRPIYTQECGFRALGGAAPTIITDKLRVDDNNTVMADRELLDCEHLKHDGRNGSPLPIELAKKLIRCLYEKTLSGWSGRRNHDGHNGIHAGRAASLENLHRQRSGYCKHDGLSGPR
jgi:hypothetical protein